VPTTILLVHVAATWFMVGLIWLIQLVHYPLFAAVGPAAFAGYAERHRRRILPVVAVPMLIELATGSLLLVARPEGVDAWIVWAGAGLIAVVWVVTAFVSSPLHGKLAPAFDPAFAARLVATNWVRTIAWSVRGVLTLIMAGMTT